MKMLSRDARWIALLVAIAVLAALFCLLRISKNPPGFYIDESSVSYNAHTIAQTGRDENGIPWPLYFRAFGDYKNPVYIYMLAALFRLTGPSILVARLLSGFTLIAAAIALGALAARVTRSRVVSLLVITSTLVTPWFFEVGRVVMEVALYPLMLAMFLLSLHRAASKARWRLSDIISLAGTLALLTYAYSIGRLLGPLLAIGLALFWTRERWRGIVASWSVYAAALIPIVLFARNHPGALTDRFRIITYLHPDSGFAQSIWEFARHYAANFNPWRLLVTGDPNPDQIVHLSGSYQFLGATFIYALIGASLVWRRWRNEAWWRFVIYGLAVSAVPASLTNENFHMLRLIALPVFLLVLAIPGITWFFEEAAKPSRRTLFVLLLGLTLLQAILFERNYHRSARTSRRVHLFDGEYRKKIFEPAIASHHNPIYLADALWIPGYIQAWWYGTLKGIDLSRFHRLPPDEAPPLGSLVISTEENWPGAEILNAAPPYTLYVANEPPRHRSPMPPEAFRAEISVVTSPTKLRLSEKAMLRVRIKNVSAVTWLARERGGGSYQVSLGNHWLDSAGKTVTNDDARSGLLRDLKPGETTELPLFVNAPRTPGEYLLEIDMLQESVSWLGLSGSRTMRVPIRVQ
jgi:4-amino-4-deoxy-L-arabinose transferase-like glycosyltransferase